MFTVKVKRPNGNEDLYEAREITKEPHGIIMQIGYEETVRLGQSGSMVALDTPIEDRQTLFGRTSLHNDMATVYVMNRFGSTIATYHI